MNGRIILTIAKKEFFSFINSPLSFVITVPFLLLSIFIFMRSSLVVGEASLRPYFELLPWFLLILAPALSMRLLTEERQKGTVELLFAHPISELDIVLGKFLGALGFYAFILAATLLLPISLLVFANPDPGILLSQYMGIFLVGATFLSLGLFASSYLTSAVGSFLLSASMGFVLLLLGLDMVTLMFPWPINRIISEIALFPHTQTISRGALDVRDMAYFLTMTALTLSLTILRLSERKLKEDKKEKRKLFIAMVLIIGIGVAANIFLSYYPLRLDLTQQKLFSLTEGTKQTISNLPDIVTISLFASRNLPGQVQLTRKEIEDLLKDYQNLSSKIAVSVVYPDQDPETAGQARQSGVEEVTFNRIGTGSFEVQTGYLGMTIRYADKTETLPFIQNSSDLEYQITRRIRKLTQSKEKTIGIYINGIDKYTLLKEYIKTQYGVKTIIAEDLADYDRIKDIDSLLVFDDGSEAGTESAVIRQYLQNEGKVFMAANGVSVQPQSLTVVKSQSAMLTFLSDFGISLHNDLIYDLRLNETLTFGGGNVRYIAPYPFWLRAIPAASDFSPLSGIKSVTLAWPSSVEISQKAGIAQKVILETSPNAGKQEETFTVSPDSITNLAQPLGKQISLAAEVKKGNSTLIVVGNSEFAADQFMQNNPENGAFIVNTVDYLMSDADIAAIPRKVESRPVFHFSSPVELIVFQYGNILVPPVVVTAFAIFRLARRRKLTKRIYTSINSV